MAAEPTRRSALDYIVRGIGAGLALLYAVPAAIYLRGRASGSSDDPGVDVGPLSALPEGIPHRVVVAARANDAWGEGALRSAVFLLRRGDRVVAYDSTCPHTGCAVEWEEAATQFRCPCHRSAFSAEGEKIAGPAPRGLDPEEVEVKNGRILLRYRKYRPGRPDRVAS